MFDCKALFVSHLKKMNHIDANWTVGSTAFALWKAIWFNDISIISCLSEYLSVALLSCKQLVGVPIEQNSADSGDLNDIEDSISHKRPRSSPNIPISTKRRKLDGKRKAESEFTEDELTKHWKDVLGDPPEMGSTKVSFYIDWFRWVVISSRSFFDWFVILFQAALQDWVQFQKKKWRFQSFQRIARQQLEKQAGYVASVAPRGSQAGLTGFFRRQARSVLESPWQIIQVTLSMRMKGSSIPLMLIYDISVKWLNGWNLIISLHCYSFTCCCGCICFFSQLISRSQKEIPQVFLNCGLWLGKSFTQLKSMCQESFMWTRGRRKKGKEQVRFVFYGNVSHISYFLSLSSWSSFHHETSSNVVSIESLKFLPMFWLAKKPFFLYIIYLIH